MLVFLTPSPEIPVPATNPNFTPNYAQVDASSFSFYWKSLAHRGAEILAQTSRTASKIDTFARISKRTKYRIAVARHGNYYGET
jgi:hypothetical protein